ncbi:hypothetical protein [Rhodanobacter sp. L36]|uniref:hypothetical protein n=1 Tax=Rhodanobacter sp. L36 TaxID=1747221 RepID=UPI00131B307C|nr:hypothetical protein [Rhodanobacter sp. L36]
MRVVKLVSAGLALALCGNSPANFAAQLYKVSLDLSHNGKLFGSPSVVIKDGADATVAVSGPNGYKLALNVADGGKGQLKIVTHLDTAYGSIAPAMVVLAGQPATVSVGHIAIGLTAIRTGS